MIPSEPDRNPLAGALSLLWQWTQRTWLVALVLYFLLIGGSFYGALTANVTLLNAVLTAVLLTGVAVARWRQGLPLLPRTALDGMLLLWAALLVVSTARSVCPRLSFEVGLQQCWYFSLFYLTVVQCETRAGRRKLAVALLVGTAAVCLLGLFQFAAWLADPARDTSASGQRIVRASFNSHNDFASFLTMLLPLVFGGVVSLRQSLPRRAAATVLLLAALLCLVLTYSRGGWLTAPVVMALMVWLLVRSDHLPRFRDLFCTNKALVGLAVLGFAGLLRFSPGGWLTARLASLVHLKDMGVLQRLVIWRVALDAAHDRPLTGWGGGSFPLKFTEYLPTDAFRELVLHAHNQYLHFAAENGFPAMLLFLATGLVAVVGGWQVVRREGAGLDLLRAACVAGAAGHLLFLLTNAESAIPSLRGTYWVLLGVALAPAGKLSAGGPRTPRFVAALGGVGLAALLLLTARLTAGQRLYQQALGYSEPSQQVEPLRRAVRLDRLQPAYREALALAHGRSGEWKPALSEAQQAVELSPRDALFWNNLGWLRVAKGGRPEAGLREFQEAQRLDPTNPFYAIAVARAQRAAGWPAEAEETLRGALALRQPLPEGRYELGRLLLDSGRVDEARKQLEACLADVERRASLPPKLQWVPAYQVGTRYRRLPLPDEVFTELEVLPDGAPVKALLARCAPPPGEAGDG